MLAVGSWPAWVLPTAAQCGAAAVRPFCSSQYPWYNKTLSATPFDPIKDPERYGETVPNVLCQLPAAGSTWPVVNPVTDPNTPVNRTNLFGLCTSATPSPGAAASNGGGTYPEKWCGPAKFPSDSSAASGYTYNFFSNGADSNSAAANVST